MLMDETTAKSEKSTETEKQNNIEKEKRKIAKEKSEAENQVHLNTKKMHELFEDVTKEERIEIETGNIFTYQSFSETTFLSTPLTVLAA